MEKDKGYSNSKRALEKAIASACRMLAIREHSEQQLRLKLLKKNFESNVINACIEYLLTEDWLSESRFCSAFIRSRANKGQGRERIRKELLQQKICKSVIDKQFQTEMVDWQSVCNDVLKKKLLIPRYEAPTVEFLKKIRKDLMQQNKRRKIENFLRYRGFSSNEITRSLVGLVK